jgi:ubiquinone/menaquinone biosynthesis C-methylase UbiE
MRFQKRKTLRRIRRLKIHQLKKYRKRNYRQSKAKTFNNPKTCPTHMDYYSTIASGYNELHRDEQIKKLRIIANHLKVHESDTLLDLGSATGLSREVFNCRITGIEPSREMLVQGNKDGIEPLQGEGEHLPFPDNSFDIVICVTALHNFHNPEKGLSEMKRVGTGKGAITVLKKAKHADELRNSVKKFFTIEKEIEEEYDHIMFFGLDKI